MFNQVNCSNLMCVSVCLCVCFARKLFKLSREREKKQLHLNCNFKCSTVNVTAGACEWKSEQSKMQLLLSGGFIL